MSRHASSLSSKYFVPLTLSIAPDAAAAARADRAAAAASAAASAAAAASSSASIELISDATPSPSASPRRRESTNGSIPDSELGDLLPHRSLMPTRSPRARRTQHAPRPARPQPLHLRVAHGAAVAAAAAQESADQERKSNAARSITPTGAAAASTASAAVARAAASSAPSSAPPLLGPINFSDPSLLSMLGKATGATVEFRPRATQAQAPAVAAAASSAEESKRAETPKPATQRATPSHVDSIDLISDSDEEEEEAEPEESWPIIDDLASPKSDATAEIWRKSKRRLLSRLTPAKRVQWLREQDEALQARKDAEPLRRFLREVAPFPVSSAEPPHAAPTSATPTQLPAFRKTLKVAGEGGKRFNKARKRKLSELLAPSESSPESSSSDQESDSSAEAPLSPHIAPSAPTPTPTGPQFGWHGESLPRNFARLVKKRLTAEAAKAAEEAAIRAREAAAEAAAEVGESAGEDEGDGESEADEDQSESAAPASDAGSEDELQIVRSKLVVKPSEIETTPTAAPVPSSTPSKKARKEQPIFEPPKKKRARAKPKPKAKAKSTAKKRPAKLQW